MTQQEKSLKKNIEMVWIKIDEKYAQINEAFRAFDRRNKNKISKPDFVYTLEKVLKVIIPSDEMANIYNFLDKDCDGYISYHEFCNLCEERQRHIDPFIDGIPYQEKTHKHMVKPQNVQM
jgi:Ca2+-binding EF-hand superfamily protein